MCKENDKEKKGGKFESFAIIKLRGVTTKLNIIFFHHANFQGINFLNVTRTQCSTHVKRVSQHSAESRGFSPGAPVSSHREVDRVG